MSEQISRRRALASIGTVGLGAALAAACGGGDERSSPRPVVTSTSVPEPVADSSPLTVAQFESSTTCVLAPEQTEGPFYFDVDAIRRDIREDRAGTLLRLGVRVRTGSSCTPIGDAVVDVWHADAGGDYSGFESGSGGPGGGSGPPTDTTYLRGAQVTDADGIVEFLTIYPGWYPGRTVHIHAKVHLDRSTVLTTQLYFADDVTDEALDRAPYTARGRRDRRNDDDSIYERDTLLTLRPDGDGYLGLITLDVEDA